MPKTRLDDVSEKALQIVLRQMSSRPSTVNWSSFATGEDVRTADQVKGALERFRKKKNSWIAARYSGAALASLTHKPVKRSLTLQESHERRLQHFEGNPKLYEDGISKEFCGRPHDITTTDGRRSGNGKDARSSPGRV